MKAPSFRCTVRPEDGALILHYYSDRPGLEHIVIGIVKVSRLIPPVASPPEILRFLCGEPFPNGHRFNIYRSDWTIIRRLQCWITVIEIWQLTVVVL
jgi:hypothetical protein